MVAIRGKVSRKIEPSLLFVWGSLVLKGNSIKKAKDIWLSISLPVRVAIIGLISGFLVLIGSLIKPSIGRYVMVNYEYPNYDIFDTATGKVYSWRGVNGLKDIDDPINNKIINVIGRKHKEYFPNSK